MKTSILGMLALTVALTFGSCKSDPDKLDYSLDGTTWVNNSDGVRTIRFQKSTFTFDYFYEGRDHNEEDHDNGTYKYTPPFVHFTALNRDTHKVETSSGKINGDVLTFGELRYHKR